ncbi:MAG: RbsD/FucU domain-containing protein [Candidatus Sulfotelmatobacter sp.]
MRRKALSLIMESFMNPFKLRLCVFILTLLAGLSFAQTPASPPTPDWKAVVQSRLALYGHRNWIVVADSAFPAYANPGIETIVVNEDMSSVLRYVTGAIASSRHVRASVFLDQELYFVDARDYPGLSELRKQMTELFAKNPTFTAPHAEMITKIDEAGKTFQVLFIKTTETIPYTTVFMRLDCGYLSDEGEQKIRTAMSAAIKPQAK